MLIRFRAESLSPIDEIASGDGTLFPNLDKDDNTIIAGLELDLPLDRLAEANEYRKSLINLTQQKRAYEEEADVVILEVRQTHREFTEAADRYTIQTESRNLAQKRFKNTFLLLQYRRASIRDVLDAQDDLFDAQNAATDALVDYINATLAFYRDTGILQVRPDGMWETM